MYVFSSTHPPIACQGMIYFFIIIYLTLYSLYSNHDWLQEGHGSGGPLGLLGPWGAIRPGFPLALCTRWRTEPASPSIFFFQFGRRDILSKFTTPSSIAMGPCEFWTTFATPKLNTLWKVSNWCRYPALSSALVYFTQIVLSGTLLDDSPDLLLLRSTYFSFNGKLSLVDQFDAVFWLTNSALWGLKLLSGPLPILTQN